MRARNALAIVLLSLLGCIGCGSDDDAAQPSAQEKKGESTSEASAATPTMSSSGSAASMRADAADYSKPEHWLCRPGQTDDACATADLRTTIIAADGTLTSESFTPSDNAPIDCFYVYPTVSRDSGTNSDLMPGSEERASAVAHLARFGSECRLYAPMYRQVTLIALAAALGGNLTEMADLDRGYYDVEEAFQYYLDHDNHGRGFVLIGHSQGSGVLTRLLTAHLDRDPVDSRLVAALLIGTSIRVPKDGDVGGTFKHLPLCRDDAQRGCVVTYASYRSTAPPSPESLANRNADPTTQAACTNPAALKGGPAELRSYLQTVGDVVASVPTPPWVTTPETTIPTPWVRVPGLISGECVMNEHGSYFEITLHGDPSDPRTDDIAGDVVMNGEVQPAWGLHRIDIELAIGNLIDLVRTKAAAHSAQ